jgi:hypothetical protein
MIKVAPWDIINRTAKEASVDVKARNYKVLNHLGHELSLYDGSDWLRLKARVLAAIAITSPSHKNLSNQNKVCDAKFTE